METAVSVSQAGCMLSRRYILFGDWSKIREPREAREDHQRGCAGRMVSAIATCCFSIAGTFAVVIGHVAANKLRGSHRSDRRGARSRGREHPARGRVVGPDLSRAAALAKSVVARSYT